MPLVKVYLKNRIGIDKQGIAFSLRNIMQKVLHVPLQDGPVMFLEIEESNWFMPEGWDEEFVFVEVLMFPGRKKETKETLIVEFAAAISQSLNISKNSIITTLHEPNLDHWGIRGGKQASSVGINVDLEV
ncbi:4-oxalocrotonate tautomerase family enzyme [Metabacillus crassostreae]|uniref:tautomerase family protein n=1 Tax=Metabacillus crassostreae TaxID=929098 RepID=UPI00195D3479|nr:tautomerase family protein [Metabacillus crassostreae]MBM7602454.1 4-oxalocrotonate tautomerase family enzyme [Metabacillus crassostreae]